MLCMSCFLLVSFASIFASGVILHELCGVLVNLQLSCDDSMASQNSYWHACLFIGICHLLWSWNSQCIDV